MKKILLFTLSFLLLLSGCAAPQEPENEYDSSAYTFTDDLGRTVTVKSAERVAVMIGSFADIWCLAGGKENIVAAANDAWTSFDLGLSENVLNLGAVKEPNLEVLLSSEPDFVIASANTAANVDMLQTFDQAGITAAYFDVNSFEEYLRMLNICTDITGSKENYKLYGEDIKDQIASSVSRADGSKPKVLYVRATGSSCKVKKSDTVLGEMLLDLGCINIADRDESLLEELSIEKIITEDPEYIFAVLQGADPTNAEETLEKTLLSNPAWQELTAVKEGRFYVLEHELYNLKPNSRWGEAYEKLAEILYP